MEDKCGVEAGRLDSDGSVCEIYFKVHFRFKELELYLSPYKNTEWPFSQNGPIKFYGIVSFLFFSLILYHILQAALAHFTEMKTKTGPLLQWDAAHEANSFNASKCTTTKNGKDQQRQKTEGSEMTKPARCFRLWEFTGEIRSGPFSSESPVYKVVWISTHTHTHTYLCSE